MQGTLLISNPYNSHRYITNTRVLADQFLALWQEWPDLIRPRVPDRAGITKSYCSYRGMNILPEDLPLDICPSQKGVVEHLPYIKKREDICPSEK